MTTPNNDLHVLVVDDNPDLRDALTKYLTKEGIRVSTAESAAAARKVLRTRAIDLIVLDVMMPEEDGLSLCRSVRESSRIPVIFLSAKSEEVERIIGLEMGADDYVSKPVNPRELLARIHAVLRRLNELPPRQRAPRHARIVFDRWTLDPAQQEIIGPDGAVISLGATEYAILMALLDHPNAVLTREQLLLRCKGSNADLVFDRSIDTHVSRLRRKLESNPRDPRLIKTAWGVGYLLAAEVERQ